MTSFGIKHLWKLVAVPLSVSAITVGHAQFIQQGNKLVGSGAIGTAIQQGISTAVSADGNTAIWGGYGDNSNAGAVWVFTRTGGVWSQQGSKLVGTDAAGPGNLGYSVALSSDGNTAIGGAQWDNGAGAAFVFTRTGGVWSQQGSKLVGTGATGTPNQGFVSISGDGNTAIVGGPSDNGNMGAVWVFTRTGNVWSQQGNKLVGAGAVGATLQGFSLSLSGDGNTAIVGGLYDNNHAGAAWVFTRTGGVWSQQGSKLVGTGAAGSAQQGEGVSISADGNTAIVGGPADNGGIGAVWVFTRTGGVWSQQGSKLVGTGAVVGPPQYCYQGTSVSLSANGNAAIVGGPGDNGDMGAVWVFTRTGGVWSQQGSKLVGTGAPAPSRQGYSVSQSADGNTALVGGYADNSAMGAAWVFTQTPAPGSIAGIVSAQNSGLAGVTAKLLDANGFPVSGFDPTVTDPNGAFSFSSVPPAGYQVMIVEPWGYAADQNPKPVSVTSGSTSTVNFTLSTLAVSDNAANWSYWKNQFDKAVKGQKTAVSLADLNSYIASIQEHYTPHFNFFAPATTLGDWQVVLSKTGHSKQDDALAELAALLMNFSSLKLGQYTMITQDNHTAGDVLTYVSGIIANTNATDKDFEQAKKVAQEANQGSKIEAGLIPTGGVLYKGGSSKIVWGGDSPTTFALYDNYPNPFNPSTTIQFDLPQGGFVSLKVYNSLGQEVASLINDVRTAGKNTVRFDASQMASGLYFYRLSAGSFISTRKMVLLK